MTTSRSVDQAGHGRRSRGGIAAAGAGVLIASVLFAAPASAADPIEEIANTVAVASPDGRTPNSPVASGGDFTTTFRSDDADHVAQVSVPTDPSEALRFSIDDGAGLPTDLAVTLPTGDLQDARVADDGAIVYRSDQGAHVVATLLDDGVRVHTVIASVNAQHSFTYRAPDGYVSTVFDDGSAAFVPADLQGGSFLAIDAPWATDANGTPVDTWYAADGDSLIQVVNDTADIVYPVVADPQIVVGWNGAAAYFNRAETQTIAQSGWTPGTAALACGALSVSLGPAAAGIMAAACAAVSGVIVYQAGIAQNSSPKRCLVIVMRWQILPPAAFPQVGTYSGGNCR